MEGVQEFFADGLPHPLSPRDVIERVRVPQRDFFGFGEKSAVVEQVSDPTSMGFVYDRVAGFLASDLRDIGTLLGEDQGAAVAGEDAEHRPAAPLEQEDDRIDVFVSHDGSQTEWTLEFIDLLRRMLRERLGRAPWIFYDIAEIKVGDTWFEQMKRALQRARVMVPLLNAALCALRVLDARAEVLY